MKRELDELITVKSAENVERLKEAISYGDISENAEYDSAKDEQAEIERRKYEIEQILRTAKIIDEDAEHEEGTIQIGRTIKLRDMIKKQDMEYKLVGSTEADPLKGKISVASAVGQHLMGHKAGDTVEFPIPAGTAKYKILEVK